MVRPLLSALVVACLAAGCPPPSGEPPADLGPVRDLNFLFVHGVESCEDSRRNAHRSLDELDAALRAALPARLAAFSPSRELTVLTAHANLYTAPPSGVHPSDSADPLKMDDWETGDPGCSAERQGDPCTTAYEWRHRLATEIRRRFPEGTRNLILVGHSTGGRVAMEVAANTGPNGVGTHDWGVSDRIVGVVSLHGMIDALGSASYNPVGTASFLSTCKGSDFFAEAAGSCGNGNGWCEYASSVDGSPSASWVAQNRRALMLIAWGSCSPALWTGYSDGLLPYDAQGTRSARGLAMTPAPGETWRAAHGLTYGEFCHSDPVKKGRAGHAASVASARDQLLGWLLDDAATPSTSGTFNTAAAVAPGATTPAFVIPPSCTSTASDTVLEVSGVCRHPGFFDGSDHPIAQAELRLTTEADCRGSFTWTPDHDSNAHEARFWWKSHRRRGGLLGSLTF